MVLFVMLYVILWRLALFLFKSQRPGLGLGGVMEVVELSYIFMKN